MSLGFDRQSFIRHDIGHCWAWIIAIIILVFFFTDLDDCFKTGV